MLCFHYLPLLQHSMAKRQGGAAEREVPEQVISCQLLVSPCFFQIGELNMCRCVVVVVGQCGSVLHTYI